jgi:membrane-bound lytic murein transglycosylase B
MAIRILLVLTAALLVQQPSSPSPPTTPPPFEEWLGQLIDEARTRGFSDQLINDTLKGLEPLPRVIESDRNQAELNPGFAKYVSSHLPPAIIRNGRTAYQQNRALLRRIEQRYGVPGRILVGIWGIETHYGRVTGRTPVFRALATLAWEPRRADFFRGELFQALMMVDRGYIDAASMTGSWAGAMGQTQFMPSSYMAYAVDFDGDGHRDIWRSTPDALASIANYLKGYGWSGDASWGREVKVPAATQQYIDDSVPRRTEGCYAQRNMTERIPMSIWRDAGVTNLDGTPVPATDLVAGLVDVGERKFLVYPNYDAILGYNCAHYYALTVSLLSDLVVSPDQPASPSSRYTAPPTRRPARTARPKSRSRKR